LPEIASFTRLLPSDLQEDLFQQIAHAEFARPVAQVVAVKAVSVESGYPNHVVPLTLGDGVAEPVPLQLDEKA